MKKLFLLMALSLGFCSVGFAAGSKGEKLKWTKEVLAEFKKTPESKNVLVSLKNPSTVMISNLTRTITVDLERSDKSYIYFLNRKELNLKNFSSETELLEKINSYLPRVAVRYSIWIGKVWADAASDKRLTDLTNSIGLLVDLGSMSTDLPCTPFRDFGISCDKISIELMGQLDLLNSSKFKATSFNATNDVDKSFKEKLITDINANIQLLTNNAENLALSINEKVIPIYVNKVSKKCVEETLGNTVVIGRVSMNEGINACISRLMIVKNKIDDNSSAKIAPVDPALTVVQSVTATPVADNRRDAVKSSDNVGTN